MLKRFDRSRTRPIRFCLSIRCINRKFSDCVAIVAQGNTSHQCTAIVSTACPSWQEMAIGAFPGSSRKRIWGRSANQHHKESSAVHSCFPCIRLMRTVANTSLYRLRDRTKSCISLKTRRTQASLEASLSGPSSETFKRLFHVESHERKPPLGRRASKQAHLLFKHRSYFVAYSTNDASFPARSTFESYPKVIANHYTCPRLRTETRRREVALRREHHHDWFKQSKA